MPPRRARGGRARGTEVMAMDRPVPCFTAKCRTVREEAGFRLTFFCALCDNGYTTPPIACDTPRQALLLGARDARLHFNRCEGCRRWVCDQHFNENRMMCVDCMPLVCARCGSPVAKGAQFCTSCGAPQFE